ncbi:MAG: SGNH/GDSL hydrolase family protein [Clostridia bacterium]|nr:SGNH/GDSL hydrolase family protein [Clostridia bacterium]
MKKVANALTLLFSLTFVFGCCPSCKEEDDTVYFSIIGDSISTYAGWSNNASVNTTIGENWVYYYENHPDLPNGVNDTWWKRTADRMGYEVLVNNSWSGSLASCAESGPTNMDGCGRRAVNLHADTGKNAGKQPDVIAVYLGTNDYYQILNFGSYSEVDFDTLVQADGSGGYEYEIPANFAEAYAVMMHKITTKYSSATVYCLPILPYSSGQGIAVIEQINGIIFSLAEHFNATYVDTYTTFKNLRRFHTYMDDGSGGGIHPNAAGMGVIADCVVEEMEKTKKS